MEASYSKEEMLCFVRQYYTEFEHKNVEDVYGSVRCEGRYPDIKYLIKIFVEYKEEIMGKETKFTENVSEKKLTEIFDLIFKKHNYEVKKLIFNCAKADDYGVLHSIDLMVNPIVQQKVKVRKVSRNDLYGKRRYI